MIGYLWRQSVWFIRESHQYQRPWRFSALAYWPIAYWTFMRYALRDRSIVERVEREQRDRASTGA